MNQFSERYGSWVLVAGAAEGLGAAFTEALAAKGMNLILADHNAALLDQVAPQTEKKYGVETRRLHLDLAGPESWNSCMAAMEGLDCRLVVYVAAFSRVTEFRNHTGETLDLTVNVNMRTVIRLVHAFTARLRGLGQPGGILLMASFSGLMAPPLVGPYAASKAFNIALAESLWSELKQDGIVITACVAGIIDTPAFRASNPHSGPSRPQVMQPADVAAFALRKLGSRPVVIPGFRNRISWFIIGRLLPYRFALTMVRKTMMKLYR
jgi:short-subunit dehydrogenase